MSRLRIIGQTPLQGTLTPLGNKNAVLPMLTASLLTDEAVTMRNVPMINDVRVMLDLLASLGVEVSALNDHCVTLQAKSLSTHELHRDFCGRVRGSILFAGPLVARSGQALLSPPGGDVIGRRRIDTHFAGLQQLGIEIDVAESYHLRRTHLKGARILLDEASVTATENVLMAATLAEGTTQIDNAASEPHVQDLGNMLNAMGAQIEGLGTNRLIISGVDALHGCEYEVQPDHIEIGSFAAAATVTGGTLRIPCGQDMATHLGMTERVFKRLGVSWHWEGTDLIVRGDRDMHIETDLGSAIPKIEDGPWPAFPSDLMSVALVMATQAHGTVLFFEKMFESRMFFVDQLISMGARIVQCDPHRVLISGPSPLHGFRMATPDIRAGMALVIAALSAQGESIIENADVIDRGYECIEQRLAALGATLQREDHV